ncbi:TPA: hypothetical protein ACIBR6_004365, partial [Salmonella enterica subsp. enterica serovar Waycross]
SIFKNKAGTNPIFNFVDITKIMKHIINIICLFLIVNKMSEYITIITYRHGRNHNEPANI